MRSVFTVENHEIAITADNPRVMGDPRSVAIRLVERSYSGGSHEVMLGIDLGKDLVKIKTPRYF